MRKKILALLTALIVLTGAPLTALAEEMPTASDMGGTDVSAEISDELPSSDVPSEDTEQTDEVTDAVTEETAPGQEDSLADIDTDTEALPDEEEHDAPDSADTVEDVPQTEEDTVSETEDVPEDTAVTDTDTADTDAATDTADTDEDEAVTDNGTDDEGVLTEEQELYAGFTKFAVNAANFPDAKFRAVVSEFDTNGDGYVDYNENLVARDIHCDGLGIRSLKGIEYLTELRGLHCMDNQIAAMDLSNNKLLTGVWCSGNLFTSLDFTPNPDLEWVYCHDCRVSYLNVSNNPKMSYIECNTNPLRKLDVTHNPLLEHLMCGSCELDELDLSHNSNLQHLDAFNNHLTTLDVTGCPRMKRLDIWENEGLGSIDVSKCPGLQYYNCAYNNVTRIDVSRNPELVKLICSYNGDLTSLDVSHNPKLVYLACECDGLTRLDLSHNPDLYFLQAFTNKFTTLNIGDNPLLIKTYKQGVKKSEYNVCKGHSWTIDLGGDTSTGGDNIYFLCFDDAVKLTMTPTAAADTDDEDDDPEYTDDLITREEAAQTLYELAGKPSVRGLTSRFTDVKHGAWYENALLWGEKNSICVGTPDIASSTFGVGKYIARQDLALMLMRYAEYKNYDRAIDFGRSDDFIDYYEIDYYAWEAVCWAATHHIMIGKGAPGAPKSERRIDPHGKATRQDFEDMISRMLEVNHVSTKTSAPDKPTLTATPGSGSVTLRWSAVSGATSYRVYSYSNGSYACLGSTTATSYTKTGLTGGVKYGFLVRAFRGDTGSAYTTADVRYATPTAAVAKPKFTVTPGNKQAVIKWSTVSGATTYRVYRVDNGKYVYLGEITGTSYTATGLANGTKYGFLVRAFKGSNGSAYTSADIVYATPKT